LAGLFLGIVFFERIKVAGEREENIRSPLKMNKIIPTVKLFFCLKIKPLHF